MTNLWNDESGPLEVWLTKQNIEVTCRVVAEDETSETLTVDSLSMRGAQREITSWMIARGCAPAGRWAVEESDDNGNVLESSRQFKKA